MGDGIIERLARIPLFADAADDPARLARIAEKLETVRYRAGKTIFAEGDEGDTLYILNAGSVRILRNTIGGERFALVNLAAEDNVFFGEIALIDSDTRSATVVALSDCETLTLSRKKYLELCEEDSWLGFRITFRVALRLGAALRKANRDMVTLYQALVEEIS